MKIKITLIEKESFINYISEIFYLTPNVKFFIYVNNKWSDKLYTVIWLNTALKILFVKIEKIDTTVFSFEEIQNLINRKHIKYA